MGFSVLRVTRKSLVTCFNTYCGQRFFWGPTNETNLDNLGLCKLPFLFTDDPSVPTCHSNTTLITPSCPDFKMKGKTTFD